MSNRFGIPDSLLDAVKNVQNQEVSKHAAFGYVTEKKKEIEELSKKTLGSYVAKAAQDKEHQAYHSGGDREDNYMNNSDIKNKRVDNRNKGMARAINKLTKESAEIEEKKMDPVGKADADIDNDGDVDSSDKYLHNRRKAIKKAMGGKKDEVEVNPKDKDMKEGKDSGLENPHNCATHVYSEQWGDGTPVKTMHADPDKAGNIAWYDVMFEHGIEKRVPIEELKVMKSEMHNHAKKGKK